MFGTFKLLLRVFVVSWGLCFVGLLPVVLLVFRESPRLASPLVVLSVLGLGLPALGASVGAGLALHERGILRALARFVASMGGAAVGIGFLALAPPPGMDLLFAHPLALLFASGALAGASLAVYVPMALLPREALPLLGPDRSSLLAKVLVLCAGAAGAVGSVRLFEILSYDNPRFLYLLAQPLIVLPCSVAASIVGLLQARRATHA